MSTGFPKLTALYWNFGANVIKLDSAMLKHEFPNGHELRTSLKLLLD
jgi:hypothetical protein